MADMFKINFSLEEIASVSVAASCWKSPLAQQKQNSILQKMIREKRIRYVIWDEVIKDVIRHINLSLPANIFTKVCLHVEILGKNLFEFFCYVIFRLRYDIKYVEEIYWTSTGEIDEMRTVNNWLRVCETTQDVHECLFSKKSFCIASAYVKKDYLHDHLEEMKTEICTVVQNNFSTNGEPDPFFSTDRENDLDITVGAWSIICHSKTEDIAKDKFERFKRFSHDSRASQLCEISIEGGYRKAFEQYFSTISANEKGRTINLLVSKCLESLNSYGDEYKLNNILRILIFLIQNMSDNQKSEFMTQNFNFLFMKFLKQWPDQEVCLKLLDSPYANMADGAKILQDVVEILCYERSFSTARIEKGVLFGQIFQTILDIVPVEAKKEIFSKDNYKSIKSFGIINCDVLRAIVNDPDLQQDKDKIVQIVFNNLKKCILQDAYRYAEVNRLMKSCGIKDKMIYDCLNTFLINGDFKSADLVLNFLSKSDEKEFCLKNEIDFLSITVTLVAGGMYDSASKFLKWMFQDDEQKRKTALEMLISNGILHDQVYKIWGRNKYKNNEYTIRRLERKCRNLFDLFFENEEDIMDFRTAKLIHFDDDSIVEKFWNNSLRPVNNFEQLFEEFLKFCRWSPELIESFKNRIAEGAEEWINSYAIKKNLPMVKSLFKWALHSPERMEKIDPVKENIATNAEWWIKTYGFEKNDLAAVISLFNWLFESSEKMNAIKEKIASSAKWWIDNYALEENYFKVVSSLFDWVAKTKLEAKKATVEFLESHQGALFIIKAFNTWKDKKLVREMLNSWLYDSNVCFSQIKINLDAFTGGIVCEKTVENIKTVLDDLKRGEYLTDSYLNNVVFTRLEKCNCLDPFYYS